ncbi:MAG: DUF3108 domain-containing protein [bacterium]|nr:DUF3108 domain-containing protein [bacterium]
MTNKLFYLKLAVKYSTLTYLGEAMNFFLILCFLLPQSLIAAELDQYAGETLSYSLKWNPLGIKWLPNAGAAVFSSSNIEGYFLARVSIKTSNWASQLYLYDNQLSIAMDSAGGLLWSRARLTDSSSTAWEVDWYKQQVYRLQNDSLIGTLLLGGKKPIDALSAFYLLRNLQLDFGQTLELEVLGTDFRGQAHFSKAVITVLDYEIITWHGQQPCWKVEIRLPSQDNFIPSGRVLVWITVNNERLPLRVVTDFYWGGIVWPIIGLLKE